MADEDRDGTGTIGAGAAIDPIVAHWASAIALTGGLALGCSVGSSTASSGFTLGGYAEDGSISSTTDELDSSGETLAAGDVDVDFDPSTTSGSSSDGGDVSTGAADSTDGGVMVEACQSQLETFATNPGWEPKNLPDGKNDYGFSAGTTQAGGGAGEIGGRVQRSSHRTSYAHVIPPRDGTSCLYASGRLTIPRLDVDFRSRVSFGHFDGLGGPHVGFDVADEDNGKIRVFIMAGGLSELAFIIDDPAADRTWNYLWDPMTSTMTLTIDGVGTVARPLSPGQAAAIQGLDRFGIRHDQQDNAENHPGVMKIYLDEIDYTR